MAGVQKAKSGHKPNLAAKAHRELYRQQGRREKNKLRRIRRSNGYDAAVAYAHKHMLTSWAKKAGVL